MPTASTVSTHSTSFRSFCHGGVYIHRVPDHGWRGGQPAVVGSTACPNKAVERTGDRERNINLPRELDAEKLAEVALALLSLTLHGGRVWKALDWDLMNLLHEKGWIADPVSKAKSVIMTEEGEELARQFLAKHFSASGR